MPDGPPKSAIEIAMAKLAKQDVESGIDPTRLTATQKDTIAAARRDYQAKVAECRILHESRMLGALDPVARQTLEAEYRRDLARFGSRRDKKIAAVTAGNSSSPPTS
jgi:hypothetical protein